MGQITETERSAKIAKLLAEANELPPKQHETQLVPIRGGEPEFCDVIKVPAGELLLNHRSHRIKSQLEGDADWLAVQSDPYGEAAQQIIAKHVRRSRTPSSFEALKASLKADGQTEHGIITRDGVLVNANTRAVAMRELDDPRDQYLRVAVLPDTVSEDELSLLELRLQMQKDLKEDYSLTNKLLFVEELHTRSLPAAQIARELRFGGGNEKKGEQEVEVKLEGLQLIRMMQAIPSENLPLPYFDDVMSDEHLVGLVREYGQLVDENPAAATEYLQSYLLSLLSGVDQVRNLRQIDAEFMTTYMLPQLDTEDPIDRNIRAVGLNGSARDNKSNGDAGLLGGPQSGLDIEDAADTKAFIDAITNRNARVSVPGTNVVIERERIRSAVKESILDGISDKRGDQSTENRLDAPLSALKQAVKSLDKCRDALGKIERDPEFDHSKQRSVEAAFKKAKKSVKNLEASLVAHGVIEKS